MSLNLGILFNTVPMPDNDIDMTYNGDNGDDDNEDNNCWEVERILKHDYNERKV